MNEHVFTVDKGVTGTNAGRKEISTQVGINILYPLALTMRSGCRILARRIQCRPETCFKPAAIGTRPGQKWSSAFSISKVHNASMVDEGSRSGLHYAERAACDPRY